MNLELQVSLPSDREIVLSRRFRAPRELVWKTMTEPEYLQRWLSGPPGWSLASCEDDRRVGGTFRWGWNDASGAQAMVMTGVNREIVPPERCVRTESFEFGCAPQCGEQLASLVLTEDAGETLLTLTVLYPSQEARDGALKSGMERGVAAGYMVLDGILAELA